MKNQKLNQIENKESLGTVHTHTHTHTHTCKFKSRKGITLISLIVTIIILLILAGISLQLIGGSNGILSRASSALDANNEATAKEKMELKITYLNMISYGENTRKATLQELADGLCADKEMEYVLLESKKTASLEKITVGEAKSIFTKLKEYPYEFEINSDLQLASMDGVKIENTNTTSSLTEAQINRMIEEKIAQLEEKYATKEEVTKVQTNLETSKIQIDTNIKALQEAQKSTFVPDVLFEGTATSGDYTIKDLSPYKYIIVYMDCVNSDNVRCAKATRIINVSEIQYNNSETLKGNTSYVMSENGNTGIFVWTYYWFKSPTRLHVIGTGKGKEWTSPRIYRIEGLK